MLLQMTSIAVILTLPQQRGTSSFSPSPPPLCIYDFNYPCFIQIRDRIKSVRKDDDDDDDDDALLKPRLQRRRELSFTDWMMRKKNHWFQSPTLWWHTLITKCSIWWNMGENMFNSVSPEVSGVAKKVRGTRKVENTSRFHWSFSSRKAHVAACSWHWVKGTGIYVQGYKHCCSRRCLLIYC